MPLHDWREDVGFNGLHMAWQIAILDWLQERLPAEYRAYVGSFPGLVVDIPNGRPDLGVRNWGPDPRPDDPPGTTDPAADPAPDVETVATFEFDPQMAIHIDRHGHLVAAVELVSPRNKDRPESRETYTGRYAGYIRQGVHLLLVDLLPRPRGFSFAAAVDAAVGFRQPPLPVPYAVSYRVGEPVPDGTLLAAWRRPLAVGQPLPTLPLALTVHSSVSIDLEYTYMQAARRLYLT
ncbi:MAG: DUF4058 family protein [Gemmataceae bacterium]|nr:DUF4058 family protein [Gemmataceae bacterium]